MKIPSLPLMMTLLCAAARAADAPLPAARLAYADGRVTVESGGVKRPGKAGEALFSGDAIATAQAATAVVELADGSQLKLRELSRVALDLPAPGPSSITEALLTLGGVFAKITKRAPGSRFRVRAGSVLASVKGTEFFVSFGRKARGGRDLWVCVNEGAVDVGTLALKNTIEVPHGRGVLIQSGRDLTKPQAYNWTKALNWNMDPAAGALEDKTNLDAAYSDLLDQDYR